MTGWLRPIVFVFLAFFAPAGALAVQPDEILPDSKLEQRAREISTGIRCMVCQNENIDDSNAPLARDLRILVRDRLKKGDSDDQVRDYLVARYGDFVLLKPPFKPETLLLWITPVFVLLGAGVFTVMRMRNGRLAKPSALSAAERAELERIVAQGNNGEIENTPITKA